MGNELRRLKPETITRALAALRAELIRDGGPGLDHMEALLQLLENNLTPVPRKAPPQRFKRGRLRLAIRIALRGRPITGPEIVTRVAAAHGLDCGEIYRSVYSQLGQIRQDGVVGHESASSNCGS